MTARTALRTVATRPRGVGAAALAAALLLAACGSSEEPAATPTTPSGPASTEPSAAPDPAEVLRTGRADREDPPSQLEVVDVVVGDGAEAVAGSRVTVQYLGVRWSDGGVFDASWTRGQPFVFDLGAGQVIPGWERGVAGMRVGGRRILVIPPQLAYGDRGAGSVIGPGETLVFAVDLVEVAGE
jgi:peptidylprolyl isomerase